MNRDKAYMYIDIRASDTWLLSVSNAHCTHVGCFWDISDCYMCVARFIEKLRGLISSYTIGQCSSFLLYMTMQFRVPFQCWFYSDVHRSIFNVYAWLYTCIYIVNGLFSLLCQLVKNNFSKFIDIYQSIRAIRGSTIATSRKKKKIPPMIIT